MDNLSFNIEHFQDNGVDYADGVPPAGSGGADLAPLVVDGNPDFNHQAPTLWKYLGVDNLNELQKECTFKCVDDGLECASDCNDYDRKCNYKCARETLNCLKDCMELRPTVMVEEAIEEEEMVEVEEKAERVEKQKPPPNSFNMTYGMYAPYNPSHGDSFTIQTEYGIYPNLIDRKLGEGERMDQMNQFKDEMR